MAAGRARACAAVKWKVEPAHPGGGARNLDLHPRPADPPHAVNPVPLTFRAASLPPARPSGGAPGGAGPSALPTPPRRDRRTGRAFPPARAPIEARRRTGRGFVLLALLLVLVFTLRDIN